MSSSQLTQIFQRGCPHQGAAAALDLAGRFAVVTGANRGIGKGVALGLGEAKATVFVTGRNRRHHRSGGVYIKYIYIYQ